MAYAKAHPELLEGGGFKQDSESDFCGALRIVEAEIGDDVEAPIRADPFFVEEHRQFEVFT